VGVRIGVVLVYVHHACHLHSHCDFVLDQNTTHRASRLGMVDLDLATDHQTVVVHGMTLESVAAQAADACHLDMTGLLHAGALAPCLREAVNPDVDFACRPH